MSIITKGARKTDAVSDIELAEKIVKEIATTCPKSATIFHIGLITSLRGCDVRSWTWAEIDAVLKSRASHMNIRQQKTNKIVKVKLVDELREILEDLSAKRGSNVYVFEHNTNRSFGKPISRSKVHSEIQAASNRLKEAGVLPPDFVLGQHSARKAKSSMMFNDGVDISIISKKLGHRTTTATANYLGITEKQVDDISDNYSFNFNKG